MKLKLNDIVIVTTGKDKGKQGKVTKLFPKEDKVLVEGVNVYAKHIKKQGERGGEKVMKERPLHAGKVAILNKETGKADRVAYSVDKAGNKVRVFAKTKKAIEV